MDKIFEKLLSSNQLFFTITIFVACMVLPGITFVYFFNQQLFLELEIIKLLLVSIIPTLLIFGITIVTTLALSIAANRFKENYIHTLVTYSSIVSAFFCFSLCWMKYSTIFAFSHVIFFIVLYFIICTIVFFGCYFYDTKLKPWYLNKKENRKKKK